MPQPRDHIQRTIAEANTAIIRRLPSALAHTLGAGQGHANRETSPAAGGGAGDRDTGNRRAPSSVHSASGLRNCAQAGMLPRKLGRTRGTPSPNPDEVPRVSGLEPRRQPQTGFCSSQAVAPHPTSPRRQHPCRLFRDDIFGRHMIGKVLLNVLNNTLSGTSGTPKRNPSAVLMVLRRRKLLKTMARSERFELPTFWSVARRSIQLSYERAGA